MKVLTLLAACSVLCQTAHAQHYAPPVDFHDVAQRRYPVEAARVLAWLQNSQGALVTEVAYQVETNQAREIVWTFEWKMDAGAPRKATVRYPEAALLKGADWYRDVWRQLTGKDWALPRAEKARDLRHYYWEGMESAGLERLKGIQSGMKEIVAKPKMEAPSCAKLAGTLVQSALPCVGVGNMVTLDGSLLARSAAWTCAAEQKNGQPLKEEWALVLALAGRGQEAKAVWGQGVKEGNRREALHFCWDAICRAPPAPEVLPGICSPANRFYAAPLFKAYDGADQGYGALFPRICQQLYPREKIAQLIDYGPELNHPVSRHRAFSRTFPIDQMRDCVETLRKLPPAGPEDEEVQKLLPSAEDFAARKSPHEAPSDALNAFLDAGFTHATGPLRPVAVVSARDLLCFAYEQGARQIASLLRNFGMWEADQLTLEATNNWYRKIAGWEIILGDRPMDKPLPIPEMDRFEYIIGREVAAHLIQQPPKAWPKTPDAYLRRRWLMDPHRAVEYILLHDGTAAETPALLRRLIKEGGPFSLGPLLWQNTELTGELPGRPEWKFDQVVERLKLREELMVADPLSVVGPLHELEKKYAYGKDPLGYARELEVFHWRTGLGSAPQQVYFRYVQANALTSATRFFDRWKATMNDGYRFATTLGAADFALSLLQGDEERAKVDFGLIKNAGGREAELAWAFWRGDIDEARKQLDYVIKDRRHSFSYRPACAQLLKALDLIPALNDPKSPAHEEALDAFPKIPNFIFAEWILAAKAKLPPAETARMLDDGDPAGERALLIAALQGDKERFEACYQKVLGPSPIPARSERRSSAEQELRDGGSRAILYTWLRNLLLKVPPPAEQPDLGPPGAEPLLPLLDKIANRR